MVTPPRMVPSIPAHHLTRLSISFIACSMKALCDQPWSKYSVGKEMTCCSYKVRPNFIFSMHPDLRMVKVGADVPQEAQEGGGAMMMWMMTLMGDESDDAPQDTWEGGLAMMWTMILMVLWMMTVLVFLKMLGRGGVDNNVDNADDSNLVVDDDVADVPQDAQDMQHDLICPQNIAKHTLEGG
mmetsp:Transcript_40256/g.94619  ORF Transcript_40256/g.94619 Transcript_40256/m.94619 type:complete len:183 (-) Transcript_40256:262-810(-)